MAFDNEQDDKPEDSEQEETDASGANDSESTTDTKPAEKTEKRDKAGDEKEEILVKKWFKTYDHARKFDEPFRRQIAIDRRYAQGKSDPTWAVTTNVIGALIDILTSLIYARDPDVSVRKSPQVDNVGTMPMEKLARTLEIVISRLWKDGKLKRKAKKNVRSILSVAEGWLKCTMIADKEPNSELETALNDTRETMAHLEACEKLLEDPEGRSEDEIAAEKAEKSALMEELEDKVEMTIKRMFAIDFVRAEQIQVSTDVDSIEDYLDANWIGNEIYVEKDDALARFPRLELEDLKTAKQYYQSKPKAVTADIDAIDNSRELTAADAESYSTNSSDSEENPLYRVIEIWDRRDKRIRTLMEGVKVWPKEPFAPPYPTSRYFPYFYTAFFETDGSRHPQSLSWRLYKLQDEYSCTRSNFRLTRERAIPATMFNATGLDDTEAKKIVEAKHQELIPIRPSDPATPLANLFAAKPVSTIDPRLYDVQPINSDMERVSGVQEALQSGGAPGTPPTATEVSVQQSGTSARTTSYRDNMDWMLTDLAQYTAEQALQALPTKAVQRMAGDTAFWPHGMDINDLFTLVDVTIKAGSTGKPSRQGDQAVWGQVLPLLEKIIGQIVQARAMGNIPLAVCLEELVKETMLRLGDDTDVTRFIPQQPPPGSPGSGMQPHAPPVDVKVQLKGEISPQAAATLLQPTLALDAQTPPPNNPAAPGAPPGGAPAPGGSPAGPVPPTPMPAPGVQLTAH
jgi:hypothetical protein